MFQLIKKEIFRYISIYYKQAVLFTIVIVMFFCIIYVIHLYRKKQHILVTANYICRMICFVLLIFYSYMLIGITILSREPAEVSVVRLELFSTFLLEDYYSRIYIYENILLFVPLAVLLYILSEKFRKGYIFLLIGLLLSLFIEVLQYVTKRGFCEIDDLLTNVIGMMIGYMIMFLGHRVVKLLIRRKNADAKYYR